MCRKAFEGRCSTHWQVIVRIWSCGRAQDLSVASKWVDQCPRESLRPPMWPTKISTESGTHPIHNGLVGDFMGFTLIYTYGYGSIPIDTFLVGWTSIYQLFWGSLGTRVLTHPHMSSSCHHPFQKRCDGTRGTSGVQLLPATGVNFIIKVMEAVGTSWANEVTKLDKKSMILTYLGFIWLYVIQDLGFIWLYMALYGFIWY